MQLPGVDAELRHPNVVSLNAVDGLEQSEHRQRDENRGGVESVARQIFDLAAAESRHALAIRRRQTSFASQSPCQQMCC